jgi:NADPH-dependent curcumin reductase CurA
MAATHKSIVLAKRPTDNIVPNETFKLVTDHKTPSADELKDGEVLFETNYVSIDPAMRGWLNNTRSYIKPVQIGEIMRSGALGTVKASKDPKFPVGSHATGLAGWTEYRVLKAKELQRVVIPRGGRLTDAMSVLGRQALVSLNLANNEKERRA